MVFALALAAAVASAPPPAHARAEAVARVTIIRATRIDFRAPNAVGNTTTHTTKNGLSLIEFQ
jgi:hypothetical protein